MSPEGSVSIRVHVSLFTSWQEKHATRAPSPLAGSVEYATKTETERYPNLIFELVSRQAVSSYNSAFQICTKVYFRLTSDSIAAFRDTVFIYYFKLLQMLAPILDAASIGKT